MKKTFQIPVVRIGYGFTNIEVKAKNLKEAEQKALDEAGDHEYSEKNADYQLEGGTPTKKIVVYISAEKETTEKLEETGKIGLNRLQKHEFNNMNEVVAFHEGIKLADGFDAVMLIITYEIKGRTLYVK